MTTKHQREQREARERKKAKLEERERIRKAQADKQRRAVCQVSCEIPWEGLTALLVAEGLLPEDTEGVFHIDKVEGGIRVIGERHYLPTLQ